MVDILVVMSLASPGDSGVDSEYAEDVVIKCNHWTDQLDTTITQGGDVYELSGFGPRSYRGKD